MREAIIDNQRDFTDPQNLLLLQMVFGTVMLGGYFLIQLAMRRAVTLKDQTRVANPGKMINLADKMVAGDRWRTWRSRGESASASVSL